MEFAPRQITLRDRRVVTLRAGTPEDADAFTAYAARLRDSTPYVVTTREEAKPTSELAEQIAALPDRPGSLLVLARPADDPARVVGDCWMVAMRVRRMAHVADLGMGCDEHWRGVGLGTALLGAAIEHARAHPALRRVELGVFSDNAAGRALYTNLGFEIEGVRPGRFKALGPGYADEVIMGRRVCED